MKIVSNIYSIRSPKIDKINVKFFIQKTYLFFVARWVQINKRPIIRSLVINWLSFTEIKVWYIHTYIHDDTSWYIFCTHRSKYSVNASCGTGGRVRVLGAVSAFGHVLLHPRAPALRTQPPRSRRGRHRRLSADWYEIFLHSDIMFSYKNHWFKCLNKNTRLFFKFEY